MKFSTTLSLIASASLAMADVTLREAAKDFTFGVAANTLYFDNEAYMQATSEFNTMVAENGCKFSNIHPEKDVYDFSDCDAHYEKAKELNMKFRGHCLLWHGFQPEWFQGLKGEDMKNAIVDHITHVLNHYKGKIDTWDVVNEVIADGDYDIKDDWVMRKTNIYREVPDFVDIAFKTAREVDPSVKLYYNDYDIEGIVERTSKANSAYNFVKDLVERGVPIDGVGLQYHEHTNVYPVYENVMKVMEKYAKLGLEVQITEIDVNSVTGNTEGVFDFQAEIYADGLRACLDSENCTGFLIWGVDDAHSWRKEGYPLIFDGDFVPKPAYYTLLNILKEYNHIEDSEDSEDSDVVDAVDSTEAIEDSEESN